MGLLATLGVYNVADCCQQVQGDCVLCSLDRAERHPGLSGWFVVACFMGQLIVASMPIGSRIMHGAIVEGCLLQWLFCSPGCRFALSRLRLRVLWEAACGRIGFVI